MSDAVILALISAIAAPLIAGGVYLLKQSLADNKESWKQRAESSEKREAELKSELLPAVNDLIQSVGTLAEGREKDREFYRSIAPAIRRVDRIVTHSLGSEDEARSRERGLENSRRELEDERY